jgi:hypothetical protein
MQGKLVFNQSRSTVLFKNLFCMTVRGTTLMCGGAGRRQPSCSPVIAA